MTSLNDNHMDKQDEIANQRLLKAAFERLADSPKEAHLLFMMAAVGGQDPEAYYFLGRQYFEGHGVDKNVAKGIEHITTSAEKGYTEASFFLACKYYWGKEVEQDYDKAYKYALAASEAGHIEACNLLADCYVHGHGVKQDSLEGVRWLHTYMERKRANDPEFAARMDEEMNEYAYLANDDFFDPEDEVEIFYHGSHVLFENFDLSHALEGDGKVKFGYGVYLTSNYASAAHYSGANPDATEHYVYTVMGVPKCEDNYIAFKQPVIPEIIARAEEQLGCPIPEKAAADGKEFRKFIAKKLTGKLDLEAEKAASKFLLSIGVDFIEWPYSWKNPALGMNRAYLDDSALVILQVDKVELDDKKKLIEESVIQIR